MKRLLAFLALCLPIYILAQGFGSFTHDQPYLAKDATGSGSNYFYIKYDVSALGYPDGTLVTNMPDTGIFSYNALASSTTAPYYTNNAGEINNEGYLVFDGTNDYVQTNFLTTFAQPLHVLMVAKLPFTTATPTGKVYFDSGTNAGGYGFYTVESKTILSSGAWCSSTNWATNWCVLEFCFDGPNSFVRTNGVLMQTGNAGTNALSGVTLGAERTGNQPADMKMAYAAFYTNVLSDATAGTETTNLATIYGITMYPRDVLNSWNPTLNSSTLVNYDLSSLRMNTSQLVTNWFDLGPLGYHMDSTNTPSAISFYNILNGRFTTRLNASAAVAPQYFRTNFTLNYPQPTTIFAVALNILTGGSSPQQMMTDNGGDNLIYQGLYIDTDSHFNAGSVLNFANDLTARYFVLEVYINGVSSYIKTNGVTAASGNLGSNGRKGITLGAARTQDIQFWDGKYAFFALYTNTLTATESSNITYYLNNRFPR